VKKEQLVMITMVLNGKNINISPIFTVFLYHQMFFLTRLIVITLILLVLKLLALTMNQFEG
jgi:hypothetical protein